MKIKWRVQPEPVGRYRSFNKRGWPYAEYDDGSCCASISCEDRYIPSNAKSGNHKQLVIRIADYSAEGQAFKWVQMKHRPKTLSEAKEFVARIVSVCTKYLPEKYKDNNHAND